MSKRIDKQKKITDTKDYFSRQSPFWYDSPLFELNDLLNAYSNNDNKVTYPYVPIRIVALLESYFQYNYSIIIDNNKKCRENCKELLTESLKIDLEVISSIENGELSFGEYISLLLPCNTLNDIINNCKLLSNHLDIENPFTDNNMVKDITEIFRYRHMFCHESCRYNILEKDKIITWLKNTINFIKHMNKYFLSIRKIDTSNIEQFVIHEFEKVDKELTIIINKLQEIYSATELFDNIDYLDEFKDYRSKRAKIEIKDYCEGDDLNKTAYYFSMIDITNELIAGLKRRYKSYLRYFTPLETNF